MTSDRMLPFSLDRFGFAVPDREPPEGGLFPVPDARSLVVGFFPGGPRTASLLSAGRRTAAAARDFTDRLHMMFQGFGHRPWAFQLVAHGRWRKRALEAFRARLAAEAERCRILLLDSVLPDRDAPFVGASAIVWSEKDKGFPLHPLQPGDVFLAAVDMRSVPSETGPPPAPVPDWCDLLGRLRKKKYPRRKGVVRFAFLCEDFRLRAMEELASPLLDGLALERIRPFPHSRASGVLMASSPLFAHSIMRRVRYYNHRAVVTPCARVVSTS